MAAKCFQTHIIVRIICEYLADEDELYSFLLVNHMWCQIALSILLEQDRKDIQRKFREYEELVVKYENSGWDTSIMEDTPILGLWYILMRDYHHTLKNEVYKLFLPLKVRIERLMLSEFWLIDKSNVNRKKEREQLCNREWFYKIPLLEENQCIQCRGTGAEWDKSQ